MSFFLSKLFDHKKADSTERSTGTVEEDLTEGIELYDLRQDESGNPLVLPRGKPIMMDELRRAYRRVPSFASRLPWVEYLDESGCFLLEDGLSVGIVAEIVPVPTEGRSETSLEHIRDQIEAALQDSLPEEDDHPWVIQFYVSDDTNPREDIERVRRYINPELLDTEYTRVWLDSWARHLRAISRPGGLFVDEVVTQNEWRGHTRRTRVVLYRWLPDHTKKGKKRIGDRKRSLRPEDAVNHVYEHLTGALRGTGLMLSRYTARDFHDWLMPWFNPKPRTSPDDPRRFYDVFTYPDEPAWSYDLAEGLLANSPKGDIEKGFWYFDAMPHAVVPVEELRTPPKIGHLTGELPRNEGSVRNAFFDQLPEGTIACLSIVAMPQEPLETHINQLREKAVGDSVLSASVRADCDKAKSMLSDSHKLYQSSLVFYVKGKDEQELDSRLLELTTQLTNANLKPTGPEDEVAALNTYLRWLPMNFHPEFDRKNR